MDKSDYVPHLSHDLESLVKLMCVQAQPWHPSVVVLLKLKMDETQRLLEAWHDIETRSNEPWPSLLTLARKGQEQQVFEKLFGYFRL